MAKQTITQSEHLQIVGLLTLAERYERIMSDLVTTLGELTGEEDPHSGHCGDAAWSRRTVSADSLLEKLNITIKGE